MKGTISSDLAIVMKYPELIRALTKQSFDSPFLISDSQGNTAYFDGTDIVVTLIRKPRRKRNLFQILFGK